MAAWRALRPADTFDTLADQVVVPPLQVADVKGDVCEADAGPRNGDGRLLRLELEDLEDAPARNTNPPNNAGRGTHQEPSRGVRWYAKEGSDAFARRLRN